MLESLFRFLFEYRPVVFQQGEFRFAPTPGLLRGAGGGVIAAVLIVVSYTGPPCRRTPAAGARAAS